MASIPLGPQYHNPPENHHHHLQPPLQPVNHEQGGGAPVRNAVAGARPEMESGKVVLLL